MVCNHRKRFKCRKSSIALHFIRRPELDEQQRLHLMNVLRGQRKRNHVLLQNPKELIHQQDQWKIPSNKRERNNYQYIRRYSSYISEKVFYSAIQLEKLKLSSETSKILENTSMFKMYELRVRK